MEAILRESYLLTSFNKSKLISIKIDQTDTHDKNIYQNGTN